MDDDDDDEKQEAKYEFSEESKLDEDHLFYLQFTNNFISNVTRPRDFDHCTRWLERLAGEPMYGVPAKRNRNMYLAMLLIAMQDNKVKGPFSSFPPPGPLANAAVAFGLTSPEDADTGSMMFDETDRELNVSDYQYRSKDGRTYIATCALPNNTGVLAFVGLTFGGGEGLWINKQGVQVKNRDEERLDVITPKTPLKRQIELIEAHHELVKKGLDQIVPDLGEDAYKFLTDLPLSKSDSNLLELGSYKFLPEHYETLTENYPVELVDLLQDFLVVSKKEIEKRLRARHDRIIKNLYAEYSAEIERGLREYKEARVEWATVYQVVAELKETLAQKEAKEAETNIAHADTSNRPTGVLLSSLNDAKKRQKTQYDIGQDLDAKKVELHKEIHDRALFHMHEIERMQGHVDKVSGELCNLRRDARKKQMVIQSLYMQTGRTMS